ncbi:hypothetical protein F5B21DRAFT_474182 [Xylaria acuta]|nr:hypothetical protein F5B21DRAFT_474182 [Xylaria acuta]
MPASVWVSYDSSDGSRSPARLQCSWSPVQDFAEYQESTECATDPGHYSVYSGFPSEELEEGWDRLITPAYFNISRDEFIKTGKLFEHIIERIGGGYIVSLNVYHELHCLVSVICSSYYCNEGMGKWGNTPLGQGVGQ